MSGVTRLEGVDRVGLLLLKDVDQFCGAQTPFVETIIVSVVIIRRRERKSNIININMIII